MRAFTAAVFAVILAGTGIARADEFIESYFFNTVAEPESAHSVDNPTAPPAPAMQTPEAAQAKSAGCMSCHTTTDSRPCTRARASISAAPIVMAAMSV